ncbi:MAG: hypothetical protein HY340_02800 [Candidatus Kerfeldbacteria bacterium]|nr:hypothetical protein [Candidatus Kerfeldbacteria bacterium]
MDEPGKQPSTDNHQPSTDSDQSSGQHAEHRGGTRASIPPHQPPPDHAHERRSFPIGRIIIGLIIVLIGLSMLANTMGWAWFQNVEWWRLWPVLIILVGLSLLTGSRGTGRLIGILFTVLLVLFLIAFFTGWFGSWRGETNTVSGNFAVPRDPAATGIGLQLSTGVSKVTVAGGASDVIRGNYTSPFGDYASSSKLSGTTQEVTVSQNVQGQRWFLFGSGKSMLDLGVTNELPVALNLDGGAATFDLDLRTVRLTSANLDVGASTINLKLGATVAKSTVNIDAGASTITITLPESVGAKIDLDAGVTSKTLPRFSETRDDVFETENYATAETTIDFDLNLGASTLRIEWE